MRSFYLIATASQILKWIKFCHFYKIYNISQWGERVFLKTAMGILLPFTLVWQFSKQKGRIEICFRLQVSLGHWETEHNILQ